MPAMPAGPHLVRFGDCTLDLGSGELQRNGKRRLLPEQPFRILSLLVRQPGALVTRDDLRREIWSADTFVDFEHSLNAAVKRLRAALGDSAATPRFIETLPRRGYRFIGELDDGCSRPAEDRADLPPSSAMPEPTAAARKRGDGLRTWWIVGASAAAALMMAGWLVRRGLFGSLQVDAARDLIRLTSTSGLNIDPALSPDGRLLAYASDRAGTGGFNIWVQLVGGGEPLRLTSHASDDAEPSFSPDCSKIVFSRRDTGLYVVGALGGEPRLIVRATWARTPRFSPDGRWIIYWTGFPASVIAGGIPDAIGSIHIVPSDGGLPRVLQPRVASARYAIWSPDGDRILFLGQENTGEERFEWYLARTDGSDLINTHAVEAIHVAGLEAGPPIPGAWSPQQDAVVFATNEADSSNVWQIRLSPSTGRVGGSLLRLTFGTASERSPSVASDRIAFTSVVENVDVWRVPVDAGTGAATGPLERVTDSTSSDRLRSVSADGGTVAFISSRTKHDEVWLRDVETGRERQVTHSGADDATLSADGSRIAFSTMKEGSGRLEIVDSTGGLPLSLCEECNIPADWSPDGERVLIGRGLPTRLFVYDIRSARQSELASHPKWNLHQARFSPDGRWVAFHTTNSPNVRQIYAAPAFQGTAVAPQAWVPIVTDHGCHPNWSQDGTLLYHFSFRDGAFCPWVQRIDPATKHPIREPHVVLHLHDARLRAASGAAATNDVQAGYFYFTAAETTGNIWMLDNGKSY